MASDLSAEQARELYERKLREMPGYAEWAAVRRPYPQRTVSLTAYVLMLAATNAGWIVGTLLYHWLGR